MCLLDLEPAPLYAEDKNSKVYLDAEFPVPVDTLFSLLWLPRFVTFKILRILKNDKYESCRAESQLHVESIFSNRILPRTRVIRNFSVRPSGQRL